MDIDGNIMMVIINKSLDRRELLDMKECFQWIFSGIGVELLKIIISLIIGGFAGYKIGVKKTINQSQIACDKASQVQKTMINNKGNNEKGKKDNSIKQKQKAGDNAQQIQTGRIE